MCTPVLSRGRGGGYVLERAESEGAVQGAVGTWLSMCLMYSGWGGGTNSERGRILETRSVEMVDGLYDWCVTMRCPA